jgi:hypothetical protein
MAEPREGALDDPPPPVAPQHTAILNRTIQRWYKHLTEIVICL